jgi:hypothetical protein
MLAASPKPPKTIAIVTSKFPSIHFMSLGGREIAKKRGLQEVLFLEWDFGNRDFGPIAARVKDAKPDLVWIGDIGLEGNMLLDAMKKIDYTPPLHFHLYPAPGPMSKAADGNNALAVTIFEEHAPFTSNPVAAQFVKVFNDRATKANLPDTSTIGTPTPGKVLEPTKTKPGTFLSTLLGLNGPVWKNVCARANGVPRSIPIASQSSGSYTRSTTTSVG